MRQHGDDQGPLHNQIPPPGPRDNNTVWYEDASPALYSELYFGVGPNAGVIVHHPNLGDVDLRGNTMANYYLEQSEGRFLPTGLVYPKWLQAAHSEGWYGADNCSGSNHNVRAADLVREVVDGVNADDPAFAWQTFDGDGERRRRQLHRHPRRRRAGGRWRRRRARSRSGPTHPRSTPPGIPRLHRGLRGLPGPRHLRP